MIKKYQDYYDKLNEESGMRDVNRIVQNQLSENGTDFEIFFHQDLDGLFSALSIREYLKRYGLELVDTHIIQYGGIEFCIKSKRPKSLGCLVDFTHNKSGQFSFFLDHHDKQTGVDPGQSTNFKKARSNSETISGVISPSDIFTDTDIELIKAVDSADFLKHDLKPEDIQNALFSYDKSKTPTRNRFLMGFVVNRLLLAFKNKRITVTSLDGKNHHINKNLLECLVMDASPSLYSLFNNLKHYINTAVSLEWDMSGKTHHSPKSLITPDQLMANLNKYIDTRKEFREIPIENSDKKEIVKHKDIDFDPKYKIVRQYGIGYVIPTGSYDRYVVFKNFPEAEFVCTIFPMGLVQVSCNPFKEKALKDIDLGAIAKEVLGKYKQKLINITISLGDIKRTNEMDIKKMKSRYGDDYPALGFKFDDLKASYKNSVIYMPNFRQGDTKTTAKLDLSEDTPIVEFIKTWMNVPYEDWNDNIKTRLGNLKLSVWDIITESSGGHPSITNIQGFGYLGCNREATRKEFKTGDWLEVMKNIADMFITVLKDKIDIAKAGKEVQYDTDGVELSSSVIVENFEYYINDNNDIREVTKDEFIETGMDINFEPKVDDRRRFKINMVDNKVIGYYESIR